jgi:hypothetical protein
MKRLLLLLSSLAALAGCPDSSPTMNDPAATDLATPDLACIVHPQTHIEFLNACTTAQSVDKRPVLPLLRADGTLPPLP